MKQSKAVGFITLLLLALLPHSIQSAIAAAPTTGTTVSWTNDTYFDAYTSQSGVTASDLAATNDQVWQLYYSNTALTIPADGVNRIGFNTYANGSNTWRFRIAISNVDDTLGNFGTDTEFATNGAGYTAGGFNQLAVTTAVTIPAHRYFIIGANTGAYYRTYKTLANNRSAQIGGLTYVTAINTIYYAPHSNSVLSGVPTSLGGSSTAFTTYNGYVAMYSIKFKATSAPTGPALTTPAAPTVSTIGSSSAILSQTPTVTNSQSYIAKLYANDGTTLLETRSVTNSQVAAGFTWTGLNPFTSYKVGLTAVGDGTNYANSSESPLTSFTTTKLQTYIALTFSTPTPTFNRPIDVTATITGSTSGKLTLSVNGKRVPNCISKTVTSSTLICSWTPSRRGPAQVSAVFTPMPTSQIGSSTSALIFILNRTNTR